MAIKQVIEIEVEAGSAKTNLKDIGAVIQEQKDITIEFEKELRNLEVQLANTSSSNMGKQKVLKTRVTDLKDALKDQRLSLKELNNERNKANKITKINTKSLSQNYGVVQLLDQVTGGLASQVRSVVDANRLFNISLKGTKTALIATGIGAFVVALGLVVAYWSDIKDFITGANTELAKQIEKTEKLLGLEQDILAQLDASDETQKRKGKTEDQISQAKKDQLKTILEIAKQNLIDEKRDLERLSALKTEGGTSLEQFARTYGRIFTTIYGFVDDLFSNLGIDLGLKEKVAGGQEWIFEGLFGTEQDVLDAEAKVKETEDLIIAAQNRLDGILNKENETPESKTNKEEKVKVDFDDTAQKKLDDEIKALEELASIRKEFADKNRDNEAVQSEVDRENRLLEIDNLVADEVFKRNAIAEVNKFYDDEADRIKAEKLKKIEDDAEKEKQILADVAAAKLTIRNAELDNVANGIGLLASLDKKSKLLQASAIIAENAVGIAKTIIGTQASNTITIAEGAAAAIPTAGASVIAAASLVAANNISAGISIATSIAATAKGLSALGGGGSAGGGGGARGGSAPRAPAFNLVKGSASNQIAESIQGQNKPIKAYVIGSDVTTSQSLDRQIEGDSTL